MNTADSQYLTVESPRLHIILYEPEIAANTGSIGRTCVAVGAMPWLVRPLGFHLDDRHRRRAGLDYWDHLNYRVVDHIDEVVEVVGRDRLWSFSTKAGPTYTAATYQQGDGLVFGPESRGLPHSWITSPAKSAGPDPDSTGSAQSQPGQRRRDRDVRSCTPNRTPNPPDS